MSRNSRSKRFCPRSLSWLWRPYLKWEIFFMCVLIYISISANNSFRWKVTKKIYIHQSIQNRIDMIILEPVEAANDFPKGVPINCQPHICPAHIIFADSAQAEYCFTFHFLYVRIVGGVTYQLFSIIWWLRRYINHIFSEYHQDWPPGPLWQSWLIND